MAPRIETKTKQRTATAAPTPVAMSCWEAKGCGREAGGSKAKELGVCPAAAEGRGRDCWLVAGTLCGGEVQGTFAEKLGNCQACDFYRRVLSGLL